MRLARIGLLVAAAAVGCVTVATRDEHSPFFVVPVGSTLSLRQGIEVPAHSASAFIQGGRVVSRRDVNLYYPHCVIELWTVKDSPQAVAKDEFFIYRVRQSESFHTSRAPTRLAARGVFIGVGLDDGGGPIMFLTELFLKSQAQPDVYRLICRQLEDPTHTIPRHVTIAEMRTVLGDLFTLKLAPVAGGP